MARSAATLASGLAAVGAAGTEAAAVAGWRDAYGTYMLGAASNGNPIQAAAVNTAKGTMTSILNGMSAANAAPAKIQAAILAFWASLVAAPATVFTGCTLVTPPPGLATIAADILLAGPTNMSAPDIATAMMNIAAGGAGNLGIHPLSLTGATATFPGPTVAPIL